MATYEIFTMVIDEELLPWLQMGKCLSWLKIGGFDTIATGEQRSRMCYHGN